MNSAYTPDFGMIMVAIVTATFPTAAIFFIMQKSFVEGMLGPLSDERPASNVRPRRGRIGADRYGYSVSVLLPTHHKKVRTCRTRQIRGAFARLGLSYDSYPDAGTLE